MPKRAPVLPLHAGSQVYFLYVFIIHHSRPHSNPSYRPSPTFCLFPELVKTQSGLMSEDCRMPIVLLDEARDANGEYMRVGYLGLNMSIDCFPRFGKAYTVASPTTRSAYFVHKLTFGRLWNPAESPTLMTVIPSTSGLLDMFSKSRAMNCS
ncbi:hypothetical protein M404DRAFT_329375 [Pisolithus tinctorius Marx 270]|uniref:Uncharacterized protein n=1 Tax=Pisolithus tinctorius Marx 270 TaxID=870435 RepID=A0A0C3JII4_PISTI|nr:hypothetical protein M404DRAFT_329375 [Pisolithus tinctorius Marx 270]